MVTFDSLSTLVAPYAPNVPAFTAANAIREAARDFLRHVFAYQREVEVYVYEEESKYEIDLCNDDIEIVSILEVKRSESDVLTQMKKDIRDTCIGRPSHYIGTFDRKIKFHPAPNKDEELTVTVAVRPTFQAPVIDRAVFDDNAEAFRWGALAILKKHPGTGWFSPEEVPYYENLFLEAKNKKAEEIRLGNMPNNMKLEIPSFL
ncbi:hypothetical protein ACQKDY_09945 [Alteromonas macleodii]|uniref:hypothetical protein n=1 Tax=Alteromonas macleodii TaxID=28108 RepID=UPI003D07B2C2